MTRQNDRIQNDCIQMTRQNDRRQNHCKLNDCRKMIVDKMTRKIIIDKLIVDK